MIFKVKVHYEIIIQSRWSLFLDLFEGHEDRKGFLCTLYLLLCVLSAFFMSPLFSHDNSLQRTLMEMSLTLISFSSCLFGLQAVGSISFKCCILMSENIFLCGTSHAEMMIFTRRHYQLRWMSQSKTLALTMLLFHHDVWRTLSEWGVPLLILPE